MSNNNQIPWKIIIPAVAVIIAAIIGGIFVIISSPQTPTTPVFRETIGEIDTDGSYEISWKESRRATHYTLLEDMDPSFTNPRTIDTNSKTRGQIYGKPSGDYYYRVRACNDAGESEWSPTRKITVIKSTPLTPPPTPTSTPTPTPTPTPAPTPTADPGETFTDTIGMEFVLIPAGEFEMGSPSDEQGAYSNEGPVHHVNMENAFHMGRYEVTQKQWRETMGDNPSHFKGDDLPVETVSWDDVQEFIKKLNEKEGTDKYRLPSEAEWEYACRAGTTMRYSSGDHESNLLYYAWYDYNSEYVTHPVGQKKPNSWGLHDMHGNVWEWVEDSWHDSYDGAPADGSAWEGDGADRVFRGGSWNSLAMGCRSAIRAPDDLRARLGDLGFRILKEQ